MQLSFGVYFRPIMLVLIPIFIVSACTPPLPTNAVVPTETPPQAGQSAEEPTPAVQPTEPQVQPTPTQPLLEARLAVERAKAKVFRSGGNEIEEIEVQRAQTINVQVDDRIEVVKLEGQEEQSHSILNFPNFLQVELFSNAIVLLSDVHQESEGLSGVTIDLNQGNIFVDLNDQAITQVTVETPYAIIRTLQPGTEFDVCHNETLTCVLVKNGVVEVIAQRKREIVKAGAASNVLKDQPPSRPICAPTVIFTPWEENYRRLADTPALDKKISELPPKLCALTADIPSTANIRYLDDFTKPSSGWEQGESDNFMTGYSESEYYQIQIQRPNRKYLVTVPDNRIYEDVNVDLRAFTKAARSGDFHYGLVFRRSEDEYYAFTISPRDKTWYFLKSSANSPLQILKESVHEEIQGLEAEDTLRVEANGSTFLLYINGRFISLVNDSDYASGEVGLFVQTTNSPNALIYFDSIIIWDMLLPTPTPPQRPNEDCFNGKDEDGDRLIDKEDPDCQRKDHTATPMPSPTGTPKPPTNTPDLPDPPTNTPNSPEPPTDTPDLPDPPTDTPDLPDPPTDTPGLPDPPTDTPGLPDPPIDTPPA